MRGIVVKVTDKNYGFIQCNGKNFFFHRDDFHGFWTDLLDDLNVIGEKDIEVRFDEVPSPKGLRAENVSRIDYPNQVEGR